MKNNILCFALGVLAGAAATATVIASQLGDLIQLIDEATTPETEEGS